jgi:hypothetical protein
MFEFEFPTGTGDDPLGCAIAVKQHAGGYVGTDDPSTPALFQELGGFQELPELGWWKVGGACSCGEAFAGLHLFDDPPDFALADWARSRFGAAFFPNAVTVSRLHQCQVLYPAPHKVWAAYELPLSSFFHRAPHDGWVDQRTGAAISKECVRPSPEAPIRDGRL